MAPLPAQPPPVASATLVVKWNTQSVSTAAMAVQYGTLVAMNGRRVTVRTRDGAMRTFTASNSDLPRLRSLVGKIIAFRLR